MDLIKVVEDSIKNLSCELVDLERFQNGKALRIFIDKINGAVTIDDCVNVSNHLTRVLEVEGYSYDRLEVSSPGDNRRLRNLDHFKKYKGSLVKIKLNTPVNGAMTITGVISDVNDEFIFLVSDMVVKSQIPLVSIEKARLVPVAVMES